MDTTASSFTLRKNAKRAAEAMIRNGTAPAVDYDINPSGNGRFEIVWKTVKAAPTSDEVETEIAEASADQPAAASPTEAASQPAPAATEPATTDAALNPHQRLRPRDSQRQWHRRSGCWCGAAARCSAIRTQDQDRGASSPPPYRRSMPYRC